MATYKVYSDDWKSLVEIAEYVWKKHLDTISRERYKKLHNSRAKVSPTLLIAALLDHNEKYTYHLRNKEILHEAGLNGFMKKLGDIEAEGEVDATFRAIHVQASALQKKLKKQVILDQTDTNSLDRTARLFAGSKWYIYERFYKDIRVKTIRFLDFEKDKIKITIQTAETSRLEWEGEAFFDANREIMVIQTFYKAPPNTIPEMYMLNIDGAATQIDLMIGHTTVSGRQTGHIISRSVIFERLEPNSNPSPFTVDLDDKEIEDKIGKGIYTYLRKREQNRISSPHETILTEDKLIGWLSDNIEEKRENRNDNFLGKFSLYYKRDLLSEEKKDLADDTIEITEDDHGDLVATYIHKNVHNNSLQTWEGEVSFSSATRAIFINLSGPKKKNIASNESPIFLILNVAPGERELNTLTGVISGIRDEYDTAIALLAVAIRINTQKKGDDEPDENTVLDFFKAYQLTSAILPPKLPVASISDLKKSFAQGNELKETIRDRLKK